MKFKLQYVLCLIAFFSAFLGINVFTSQQKHATSQNDQAEYRRLSLKCNKMVEEFTRLGGSLSSPVIGSAIANYLKGIGTPVALRVLRDQVSAGRVPKSYLQK